MCIKYNSNEVLKMATLKYDVDRKLYTQLKDKITAPKFQRNFVWKKKARRELIHSIKQGLPIGSFLLQKLNDGKYNIIDGRQRFSTLLDYEYHRYEYIEESDIDEQKIVNLLLEVPSIAKHYQSYNDSAKHTIVKKIKNVAIKQLKTKNTEKSDVVYEIMEEVKTQFPNIGSDAKKLYSAVNNFYDEIWQILDTTNIVLPCIIFNENATDDEIVTTFINLNSKGTKLSKYDLYSASWQNDIIVVNDEQIIEKVISKYKDSLENNQKIETQNFNETEIRNNKEINVFEYAYALSKLIGEACQNKIYQVKDASEVDSLGFSILASILNVNSKNMVGLSKKLVDSHIDCAKLKDKIIACTLDVQKELEWYCTTPDGKYIFAHTLNQLVSYIVTVFKAKFVIEDDGRILENHYHKNRLKDFERNLPMWYLYDNIRGYWAGSGDTKLDGLVMMSDIYESRYFTKVSSESFKNAIYDWITEENAEKNATVKPETKLFINYIIKKNCSEPHKNMDIEHIIPQSRLDSLSVKERGIVGISSPANLTFLPSFDNRSKREKTYYELIESKDATALTYDKELLEKYLYPEHNEIKFIESQSDFTVTNFNRFKKDRANTLINMFVNAYYKED